MPKFTENGGEMCGKKVERYWPWELLVHHEADSAAVGVTPPSEPENAETSAVAQANPLGLVTTSGSGQPSRGVEAWHRPRSNERRQRSGSPGWYGTAGVERATRNLRDPTGWPGVRVWRGVNGERESLTAHRPCRESEGAIVAEKRG